MTLATAKKECDSPSLRWLEDHQWGQYIVKPGGARTDDPRTYFNDDLADVVWNCADDGGP